MGIRDILLLIWSYRYFQLCLVKISLFVPEAMLLEENNWWHIQSMRTDQEESQMLIMGTLILRQQTQQWF